MAYIDLTPNPTTTITTDKDNLVIKRILDVKEGGVIVDTTGYTEDVISAGHIVISLNGVYKLMPVSGTAFDTLPENAVYEGFVVATTPTAYPAVGVLIRGTVNPAVLPYTATTAQLAAIKTALPTIIFETE